MAEVLFGAKEPERRRYGFGLGKEALGGEFPLDHRVSDWEVVGWGRYYPGNNRLQGGSVAYVKTEKNHVPVNMGQKLHGGEVRRARGVLELDARGAGARLVGVSFVPRARHDGGLSHVSVSSRHVEAAEHTSGK